MAEALDRTRRQFIRDYALRIERQGWILRDRMVSTPGAAAGEEKWCIFLDQRPDGRYGCQLHEVKPLQCRNFPRAWQNPDSPSTCVGLRALGAQLRRQTD